MTRNGEPTGYGLGWYVSDFSGGHVLHHGGCSIGFSAYVFWLPSRALFAGVFKISADDKGESRARKPARCWSLCKSPERRPGV